MQIHPAVTNKKKYFHKKQHKNLGVTVKTLVYAGSVDTVVCWAPLLLPEQHCLSLLRYFCPRCNCYDSAVLPHKFLSVPSNRDCRGEVTYGTAKLVPPSKNKSNEK